LTAPPFQTGDFVWCAFPERERPANPNPAQHLAYILALRGGVALSVIAAYTTSQVSAHATLRLGVRAFDRTAAASLGQHRPFLIDLRRLAYLPVTAAWFPRLDEPARGVQGHAPKALQRELMQTVETLLNRHQELVEQLGPIWRRETP
jgi:hypothetical protein